MAGRGRCLDEPERVLPTLRKRRGGAPTERRTMAAKALGLA
jgi:hypothetical protein